MSTSINIAASSSINPGVGVYRTLSGTVARLDAHGAYRVHLFTRDGTLVRSGVSTAAGDITLVNVPGNLDLFAVALDDSNSDPLVNAAVVDFLRV